MLKVNFTSKFKKDFERVKKQRKDMKLIKSVMTT
jgi:mRNA-degrading endonuclease YafQ of YafQ-DinJ toxin-antitoxin module